MPPKNSRILLRRGAIAPRPLTRGGKVAGVIDNAFLAYNAARLREAAELYAGKMLAPDVTVGLTLTGALTPAGLGMSCLIPLIKRGYIDWIVSTGANLYHDTHFGIGLSMHRGHPGYDDTALRRDGVVRIYDIVFDYRVLLDTDAFYRRILAEPEFQKPLSTAEFHHRIGRYVAARERSLGLSEVSLVAAAHRYDVPVYTSSPGDSSIGMNVAALALDGYAIRFDPSQDVNETAAIVLDAKRRGGKSAIVIFGGGSPKNFALQTEPQIQEVLGIEEKGHDYFLQVTDARPDTGGLSGATPAEAVSWGKIDPDMLPDTVVCYCDSTIAMPLITQYLLDRAPKRTPKRLYRRLPEMMQRLKREAEKARTKHGKKPPTVSTRRTRPG